MLRQIAVLFRHNNGPLQARVLHHLLALGGLLLFALPAAAQGLPNLAALQSQGAAISAMVVDLERRSVVAALHPDRPVIPASATKLVTAARALEIWGADHRFTTRLAATARPQGGRLPGDLLLIGGGDPALTEEALWEMARALAHRGIREITGDIIIDASRFGEVICSMRDRCEALQQNAHSYAAPLSAAGVNFSTISLELQPGARPGEEVRARLQPFSLPSFEVASRVMTANGANLKLTAVHRNLGDRERTEIAGAIPLGSDPIALRRSVAHPERLTGELLRVLLEREGISVAGELRFAYQPHFYEVVLAEHESAPLGDLLKGMMYYSNNFSADVLALELARTLGQAPPLSLPQAGAELGRYLHRSLAASPFAEGAASQAYLRDGSGLDPDNRVSARELIALLAAAYDRLDLFQPLLGSLPVPAHARSRLLKGDDPLWSSSVAGKTGGLSVPLSVTSYAGYLRFADGRWGAFAFIVNGAPGKPVARADAFAAMRRDFLLIRSANAS